MWNVKTTYMQLIFFLAKWKMFSLCNLCIYYRLHITRMSQDRPILRQTVQNLNGCTHYMHSSRPRGSVPQAWVVSSPAAVLRAAPCAQQHPYLLGWRSHHWTLHTSGCRGRSNVKTSWGLQGPCSEVVVLFCTPSISQKGVTRSHVDLAWSKL